MKCRLQETRKTAEGKDIGSPQCKAFGCDCQFAGEEQQCPMAAAFDQEVGEAEDR